MENRNLDLGRLLNKEGYTRKFRKTTEETKAPREELLRGRQVLANSKMESKRKEPNEFLRKIVYIMKVKGAT